ncbi:Sulfur carrier protein TusA [Sinobacterium norvegicum]|uniref:Sulfur carrier protein TusA n=2 Tax=Sinobacterium norvegicum TaxID=1641715 RepID=A0ABM9ABN4_9GAMM|nr:Sulfur carrier protein TusA [Sinobacterium norvegicum]
MIMKVDLTLDACGLYCPEPVMMLHNKVRDIVAGTVLEVIATDPSTERDIPKFCNFLGHELLESRAEDGKYFYYIRKSDD